MHFLLCVSVIMGGWIEGKEGRKESKNLWFFRGSHSPESLFVHFIPAHLCIVCPVYVLWLSHSNPLFLLEGEFAPLSPTPLPHSIPAARCTSSSITGPFTKPNHLVYLLETSFCWVSELNWCTASSERQGRERERVDAWSKKGKKHSRTKSFLV